ncbi:MAG TPA: hypothetical protein VGR81_10910 [Candidatus Acidoferrales bacterium]|nr:hypothetical protein [Candidatus Acidoferrales bacterium]
MVAALILVISAAMMAQFVVFFWRANMVRVAAQPVSERLQLAGAAFPKALNQNDFSVIAAISHMCPGMDPSDSLSLWPVRAYYAAVRLASMLSGAFLSSGSGWTQREMAACTRYVAVSIDARLRSNQAYLAELRSY